MHRGWHGAIWPKLRRHTEEKAAKFFTSSNTSSNTRKRPISPQCIRNKSCLVIIFTINYPYCSFLYYFVSLILHFIKHTTNTTYSQLFFKVPASQKALVPNLHWWEWMVGWSAGCLCPCSERVIKIVQAIGYCRSKDVKTNKNIIIFHRCHRNPHFQEAPVLSVTWDSTPWCQLVPCELDLHFY